MVHYPEHNYGAQAKPDVRSTASRFTTFIGGKYAPINLSSLITMATVPVSMQIWSAPGLSRPTFDEAKPKLDSGTPATRKLDKGFEFGPSWTNHWIKLTAELPGQWSGGHVELVFDPSCEAMIFADSGLPLQAITGGFDYNRRVEYIVPPKEVKARKLVRYIEVSANGVFGVGNTDQEGRDFDDSYYKLETAEVRLVNREARQLSYDFQSLVQIFENLPEHSPLANRARRVANEIMNHFKADDPDCVSRCRRLAEDVLGQGWEANALKEAKAGPQETGTLWAIGHCHIDTAWLWPWSATRQKIARSWSNQIDLMNQYPEHKFVASAAQHYKWLEEDYPLLWDKLVEKIKGGRFEFNGGNWVEMDTLVPSGEALARQFLYGQRYWQKKFGRISDICILPDSFGFTAQLPQIARLGGCANFFTHKLNWSKTNTFPLTTFNWVGLDGTQVLAHIIPIQRYDSLCTMDEIMRAYVNHKNLDVSPDSVLCYGHGDGGGGPTPVMMERLRRARATAETHDKSGEGIPYVKTNVTLSEFYDRVRETTKGGKTLPAWNGEMYLEIHRGCATSQAFTKQSNRRSEILLREIELFSTLASIHGEFKYPKAELDELWENVLLCQFHDTMSGSMIHLATEQSDALYRDILGKGHKLFDNAITALSASSSGPDSAHPVLNTLPCVGRTEVITHDGKPAVAHIEQDKLLGSIIEHKPKHPVKVKENKNGCTVSNAWMSLTVADGRITSIFDHRVKRELVAKGDTAGFRLYQDIPDGGEAWEVEPYTYQVYDDLVFSSCEVVEDTPLRATLALGLKFGQSSGTVHLSLSALPASSSAGSTGDVASFSTTLDWQEQRRFLKFHLPLALFARECTYETAFGLTRRPTSRNHSWESVQFEVSHHKFMDYSEHGFGVAIVNDSKYGASVQGNVMELSLLRGTAFPDHKADLGQQTFKFGVFPHRGFQDADVQGVAQKFNNPLRVLQNPLHSAATSCPFTLEGDDHVLLETIKRGEDDFDPVMCPSSRSASGKKTVVLRLYEHMGGHARVKLGFKGVRVSRAALVDILEREIEELDVVTDTDREAVELEFRAFEIKTVLLTL